MTASFYKGGVGNTCCQSCLMLKCYYIHALSMTTIQKFNLQPQTVYEI